MNSSNQALTQTNEYAPAGYIVPPGQRLPHPRMSDRKPAISEWQGRQDGAQDKMIIWLFAITMLVLGSIVDRADP